MGAAEVARATAERERAREAAEKRQAEAEAKWQAEKRVELERHVERTLQDFADLGFKKHQQSLLDGRGKEVARAWVDWHTWEFQGSDESPVIPMAGYVIYWRVEGHWHGETTSLKADEFDQRFGEAMARHVK